MSATADPHSGFTPSLATQRERMLFQLLIINKWFLIPTAILYQWMMSLSPVHAFQLGTMVMPLTVYITLTLLLVALIWIARQRIREQSESAPWNVLFLMGATFALDGMLVFYLAFSALHDNLLWLLFFPTLGVALLLPFVKTNREMMLDSVAAAILFAAILLLTQAAGSVRISPRFIPADILLSLSGLLFHWTTLRIVQRWTSTIMASAEHQQEDNRLWGTLLSRFPADYFVVDTKGSVLMASDSAHERLHIPVSPGDDWPEDSQTIRNALLHRFHAETSVQDSIEIPDSTGEGPLFVYPHYLTAGSNRVCLAVIHRRDPNLPQQPASILRSDRLTIAGQIAAGLAHEIGNPLGVIRSCASYLAQKHTPDHPNHEEFELIESEAKRCQQMIDRLLSLASPKRDTPALHDLRTVLEHALSLVKYQAGERPLQLNCPGQPVTMVVNEGQLSAVMVNLFLNALQSMENSPPEARLSIELRTRGDEAIIDISDEGVGIPAEELDRIFDPFFTRKAEGTGLGLSIVHQIITSLGGRIDVASVVGKGTTFTVHLPLSSGETLHGEEIETN